MINNGVINNNLTRGNKAEIVGWSMPSGEYIEYTATDGGEYTAPANGYFTIGLTDSGEQFVFVTNNNNGMGNSYQYSARSDVVHATSCPVQKGDVIKINYNGYVHYLRFIYAEGEI